MVLAVQLASALEQCTAPYLLPAAVQMEIEVAAMLAHMESVGMGECQVLAPTLGAERGAGFGLLFFSCCVDGKPAKLPDQTGGVLSSELSTVFVLLVCDLGAVLM